MSCKIDDFGAEPFKAVLADGPEDAEPRLVVGPITEDQTAKAVEAEVEAEPGQYLVADPETRDVLGAVPEDVFTEVYRPANGARPEGAGPDTAPADEQEAREEEAPKTAPELAPDEEYEPDNTDDGGFEVVHKSHVMVARKVSEPITFMEAEHDPSSVNRQTVTRVITDEDVEGGVYIITRGGGSWAVTERELDDGFLRCGPVPIERGQIYGPPAVGYPQLSDRTGRLVPLEEAEEEVREEQEQFSGEDDGDEE